MQWDMICGIEMNHKASRKNQYGGMNLQSKITGEALLIEEMGGQLCTAAFGRKMGARCISGRRFLS